LSDERLIREYLHLVTEQVKKWSHELQQLQPRHRRHKLTEFQKIIHESVESIQSRIERFHDFPSDVDEQTFLIITIETIAITAAKQIETIQFTEYGEDALLSHILACHDSIRFFPTLRVHSRRHQSSSSLSSSLSQSPSSLQRQGDGSYDMDSPRRSPKDISSPDSGWVLTLSWTCIEKLGRIFLHSGTTAAIVAVKKMSLTTQDLVSQFFVENQTSSSTTSSSSWLSGQLCQAYLARVSHWMEQICSRNSSTLNEFHRIIHREVIRLVLFTYISTLISKYRLNKRFKLSEAGETRISTDLKDIHQWILQQNQYLLPATVQDKGSYTGSNDILMLIRYLRMFITSDESNLMICFIESIQHFGLLSAPHLYDIARLAFKVRSDLTSKQREHILSGFALFMNELSSRTTSDDFRPLSNSHPRLSGPEILSELCPSVGVYHCTGKKWSYENTIDPSTRQEINQLVNDACQVAQIRRSGMAESLSSSSLRLSSLKRPSKIDPNTAFEQKCLENLLRPSSSYSGGGRGDCDDDRSHEESECGGVDSVTLAIDNITFLDDELTRQTHLHNRMGTNTDTGHGGGGGGGLLSSLLHYSRNIQPDVAFNHCSFEELHLKLRPFFYGNETWTKPQFTTPTERRGSTDHLMMSGGDEKENGEEGEGERVSLSSSDEDEFVGYDGVFLSSGQIEGRDEIEGGGGGGKEEEEEKVEKNNG
jgi:hypothetical protein